MLGEEVACLYEVYAHFLCFLHSVIAYSAGNEGVGSKLKSCRNISLSVAADHRYALNGYAGIGNLHAVAVEQALKQI